MFFTYILKCNDDTLYTGYTNNLENRLSMHNKKLGAKYTRARIPVSLEYYEIFSSKSEAMKREYSIKQLKRVDKLELIKTKSFSIIK